MAGDQVRGDSGAPLLQLTDCTEVTEGFSGAPVLDERTGAVIGMVDAVASPDRLGRGQATVYVTPTETLREVCPELTLTDVCPYRGLEPFTAADAGWFHGRARVVDAVLASLRRERRFLALLGPSGSGKSSLIHAGVQPALADGALPGSEQWGWLSVRPAGDPFAQLEQAGLSNATHGLAPAIRRWLDDHPKLDRLVLVLDQFEELLVAAPPAPRAALLEQLIQLGEAEPAATVILVLRDDFYSRLAAAAPTLMRLVEQALINVPAALEVDELAAIITQPAISAGLTIEPSLPERIVGDAARAVPPAGLLNSGAATTVLPLLEFALTELWRRREDGRLTHHAYEQIGGVVGGLANWCDQAYGAIPESQRPVVRQVVTSLVHSGDDAANIPATRQRRTRDELRTTETETGPDEVDRVVTALADRRLLVTSRDPTTGEPIVELVHEALIREWGLLRQWLAEDHDFLAWRDDLETDYVQWVASTDKRTPHDPELLLRGSALEQALSWLSTRPLEIRGSLVTYVQLSDRAQRDRLTRDRRRAQLLAILLVIAIALGSVAVYQADRVQQQALRATSQRLAAQAGERTRQQPDLAQLLSLESLRTARTQDAWAAIQQTLSQPLHPSKQLVGHTGRVTEVAFSPDGNLVATASLDGHARLWNPTTGAPVGQPLTGHTEGLIALAFNADGSLLATASHDRSARLWDPAMGQPIGRTLIGHTDAVTAVAFNPVGTLLATASNDGTARLWDPATGLPIGAPLTGHRDAVTGAAFSPDGSLLATASQDSTVRLWDPTTGLPIGAPLTGHTKRVVDVAFSPDGSLLATSSGDNTALVWNVATRQPISDPLPGHTNRVTAVAFSPDTRLLATASLDGTVRLWDPSTGRSAGDRFVDTERVLDVAFSPDSTRLATASEDSTARVWTLATSQPLGDRLDHADLVTAVAFSPNGELLATGDEAGAVRLWDPATTQLVGDPLVGHLKRVTAMAFSPDGNLLATSSQDHTARLWNLATRQPVGHPLSHSDDVTGIAFNHDGSLLATSSMDGTARLWDPATGQPVGPPLVHTAGLRAVAFSPDGRLLAIASIDHTARLWNVATRQPARAPLTGHRDAVTDVVFSPDGSRLATAGGGKDDSARLWDTATGTPIGAKLTGSTNAVTAVAFSPDGRLLAVGSRDGTARLYDPATGRTFGDPLAHDAAILGVAFSPDSTMLATASEDRTARLWASPITWVDRSCELVGRNLRRSEWESYAPPETRYVRTCPQYPSGVGADPAAAAGEYPTPLLAALG